MFIRRIGAVLVLAALGTTSVRAQGFGVGSLDVGPVIGLGGIGDASLAFGGRIEKAIKTLPDLGSGVLGIAGSVDHWSYNLVGSYSYTMIGAIATYHFKVEDKQWDPFIGLGLGDVIFSGFSGCGPACNGLGGLELIARGGVRYYFTPKTAGYADVGSGAASLNIGVMFKLK